MMRSAAAIALALLLAGCGGLGQTPPAMQAGAGSAARYSLDGAAVPRVAGTYRGRYAETIGKTHVEGTVTIVVHQRGSIITGRFRPQVKGVRYDLGLKGTVDAIAHGARLHFTIFHFGGRNARARAFVIGTYCYGRGLAPPEDGEQSVHIMFRTEKQ